MKGIERSRAESKEKKPEFVDLYNERNEPLHKSVSRDQAHAEGLWHRTVHIYITRFVNGNKELLVHIRSKEKKQYPGKLDPVFGGHITSGMDEAGTVLSELTEEIGITPEKEKLVYYGFVKKDDDLNAPGDKEFNMIYTYELSTEEQNQIVLQEKEIESAHWIPFSELYTTLSEDKDNWRPSIQEIKESLEILSSKE